jgi:hypothetical protein
MDSVDMMDGSEGVLVSSRREALPIGQSSFLALA